MEIKKASDKPMKIHQKQKAELHICHNNEMKPRGNIKHVNRSPKIKSATLIVRESSGIRMGKNTQHIFVLAQMFNCSSDYLLFGKSESGDCDDFVQITREQWEAVRRMVSVFE